MKWNEDNSYLLRYRGEIQSGSIIAGQELIMELDNLAEDFHNDDYFYDTASALLRMDFIEGCIRLTKSPYYGKPMKLLLWQKAFIEALYSFKMSKVSEDGIVVDRFKRTLLLIGRKNGKALALDTRIPTPTGDSVKVLATSEIFKNRKCYEFTFEDGEKIICDAEHKWTVCTKSSRRRKEYISKSGRKSSAKHPVDDNGRMVMQAFEMVDDFKRIRHDKKGIEYKYRVPMADALDYPKKELPLHPYILGLWLGDGDKNDNRIAVSKDDLNELCELIKES